jgi:hypothetical protein
MSDDKSMVVHANAAVESKIWFCAIRSIRRAVYHEVPFVPSDLRNFAECAPSLLSARIFFESVPLWECPVVVLKLT